MIFENEDHIHKTILEYFSASTSALKESNIPSV